MPGNSLEMEISSIKRTSASDEIFKILHQWILSGKLKPGDMLPSQDRLAKEFGVSRNTLREAIYKLTVIGLLEARQGVGTVVNIKGMSSYMDTLADHLLLQSSTVRDFLEARFFVERATVRLAAIRATPTDIDYMKNLIEQQRRAFRKGYIDQFSKLDADFHMALARSSQNDVLVKFLEIIRDLLKKFIGEVAQLPDAVESAIRFHGRILELICSGQGKEAEKMICRHLNDVARRIEKHVGVNLDADDLLDGASYCQE